MTFANKQLNTYFHTYMNEKFVHEIDSQQFSGEWGV